MPCFWLLVFGEPEGLLVLQTAEARVIPLPARGGTS